MKKTEVKIFFSWQSDLPNNQTRGLIQEGINSAVKMLRDTVAIEADRDTRGEYGSPDIVQTVFSKIDDCDIFIADVSIVNKYNSIIDDGNPGDVKYGPNPNVMLELGYAAKVIGWENIICLFNRDYGTEDDMPFDLDHRRLSSYSLESGNKAEAKKFIKDIIVSTVSNLLENGPRVKQQFANIVVGQYDFENDEIIKTIVPYCTDKYYDNHIKEKMITNCKNLINEINEIHLDPCTLYETIEQPSATPGLGNLFADFSLMNGKPQRVTIKESDRETIIKFAEAQAEIKLSHDFFELGNLKKRVSLHIADSGTTYEGNEQEKKKYDLIHKLDYKITQMQLLEMYSKSFGDYLLFPLAIKNISTVTDEEISISIIVDSGLTVSPSRRIINPDLQGIEGLIYEEGIIKKYLLMPENAYIKYGTEISFSLMDGYNPLKHYGVNGARYDAEDYENELSKYIATAQGPNKNEYEFYIKSLRPKETCWLGPMIMIKNDSKRISIRYSIKSNKSDGNLSGILQYAVE